MFEGVDRFSSFGHSIEDPRKHIDLGNGQTSIERAFSPEFRNLKRVKIEKKDSSSLPNKYNQNQNQNNRIPRETEP